MIIIMIMGAMALLSFSASKNVVLSIFFEKISILDSFFIHKYIIIKYMQRSH